MRLSSNKLLWLCLSVVLSISFFVQASHSAECVRLYYDRTTERGYWMGQIYAVFTQNLLGHFPEVQQIVLPIEDYKKGDIEQCRATIYLASFFNNQIPEDFLQDFKATQKNVAWIGYSIWQLGVAGLRNAFGVEFQNVTRTHPTIRDRNGRPTFFKNVYYKGEKFWKYGEFDRQSPDKFLAGFETNVLKVVDSEKVEVLAKIEHNGTGEKIPYALRSQNRFYMADIPMSFIHENDRYLVYADLLFDILQLPPKHGSDHYAVFRLEDIHARIHAFKVYDILKVLKKEQIPFHTSIIPIFYDPLFKAERDPADTMVLLHQDARFLQMTRDIQEAGGKFIWHGVTHQYRNQPNPHSGLSGDDFEFWDAIRNQPIAEDSVDYVLRRLDDGMRVLERAGIQAPIWLTPHYQASALDSVIFGHVFKWSIGRVIYFPFQSKGDPATFPKHLQYGAEPLSVENQKKRRQLVSQLEVRNWGLVNGQFFPYEIYGDVYGQKLFPENLGNPQPFRNSHVTQPRSVDDLLASAKRNLVIRDAWGSFFFHPQLVSAFDRDGVGRYPGDVSELVRLIRGLKSMGYQFIDLEKFIAEKPDLMRPPSIVKYEEPK